MDIVINFFIAVYMGGLTTMAIKKYRENDYFGGFAFITPLIFLSLVILFGIVEKLN